MKKLVSRFLVLAMIFCSATFSYAADSNTEAYPDNAIEISNLTELRMVAEAINLDINGGEGDYYILTADIDMKSTIWDKYIGNDTNPFKGIFDGNSHIVKNYKLNCMDDKYCYGLFGIVGGSGIVKNFGVEDVSATLPVAQKWIPACGGLVGKLTDTATVTGCFARNVSLKLGYDGNGDDGNFIRGGGLIGSVGGLGAVVENCYAVGSIMDGAEVNYDGGLVGSLNTTCDIIRNCYSDTTLVRCDNGMGSLISNSYFEKTAPWPWEDPSSASGYYAGKKVTAEQLKNMADTLGEAFQNDSQYSSINNGYPVFVCEADFPEITGTGTESDPYLIRTGDNLAEISTYDTEGKYFKLMNDLNLGEAAWTPYIGTEEKPFKGIFDGNGHVIKNYKVNAAGDTARGIFAFVGGSAHIYSLGIENVEALLSVDEWNAKFGGLVGKLTENAKVTECFAKNVSIQTNYGGGRFQCGGGLIGNSDGTGATVENCYAVGIKIIGDINYDAGIVGGLWGSDDKITNCYSDTTLACYLSTSEDVNITNSYYGTTPPWPNKCAKGNNTSADKYYGYVGTQITTDELKGKAAVLGTAFTADLVYTSNGYPILKWEAGQTEIEGEGTADMPYLISSIYNLAIVSTHLDTEGKYYKLMNDLDLGNAVWMSYIGTEENSFKGDFDGNGHIIRNYKINIFADTVNGLFAYVGGLAHIHNLGIENVNIVLANEYSWGSICGGLAGFVADNAAITKCFAKNVDFSATFVRDSSKGEVRYGGGLIGQTNGEGVEVRSCYSSGFSETVAGGGLPIVNNDGGLIGEGTNCAIIENCYSNTTLARTSYWVSVVNSYQQNSGTEWPIGDTWGALVANIDELGYEWCNDFKPVSGGYPILKWEDNAEIYLNLVHSGIMNITDAKSIYNTTNAEIVSGKDYGRNSEVMKLPSAESLKYDVELSKDSCYRVSFRGRAVGETDTGFTFKLGEEDLTEKLNNKALGNKWENKVVYVLAATDGNQTLEICGNADLFVDDVKIVKVNQQLEMAEADASLKLTHQKLETVDCDIYVDDTICDGLEIVYTESNGYIDGNGKLTTNIPLGLSSIDAVYTATVNIADKAVSKSMNMAVKEREPYDIENVGLLDADGNTVYGLSNADKVGKIYVTVNSEDKDGKLYAALYKDSLLTGIKKCDISGDGSYDVNLKVENDYDSAFSSCGGQSGRYLFCYVGDSV